MFLLTYLFFIVQNVSNYSVKRINLSTWEFDEMMKVFEEVVEKVSVPPTPRKRVADPAMIRDEVASKKPLTMLQQKKYDSPKHLTLVHRYKLVSKETTVVQDFGSWYYNIRHALQRGMSAVADMDKVFMVIESEKHPAPSRETVLTWVLGIVANQHTYEKATKACQACLSDIDDQSDHVEGCLLAFDERMDRYYSAEDMRIDTVMKLYEKVINIMGIGQQNLSYLLTKSIVTETLHGVEFEETVAKMKRDEGMFTDPVQILLNKAWEMMTPSEADGENENPTPETIVLDEKSESPAPESIVLD
jgi:hypothetical protein